jgi:hypothetical protein
MGVNMFHLATWKYGRDFSVFVEILKGFLSLSSNIDGISVFVEIGRISLSADFPLSFANLEMVSMETMEWIFFVQKHGMKMRKGFFWFHSGLRNLEISVFLEIWKESPCFIQQCGNVDRLYSVSRGKSLNLIRSTAWKF